MNRDTIKNYIDIAQSIVVIAGVLIALCQLKIGNDALKETREIESGKFILELSKNIDSSESGGLISAIEDHDENFPILRSHGGKFSDNVIEDYIGKFETIGDFERRKLIDHKMAYNEFAYSVEKAWCNKDVRRHINEARMENGGHDNDYFINFENLAKSFLKEDKKEDCRNLS